MTEGALTADPNAPAHDPLRLAQCPTCGYNLTGLPAAGVCPECGLAYDEHLVVLYGYAAGMRGSEWTGNPRAVVALALLAVLNVLGPAVNGLVHGGTLWLVALLAWVAIIASVIWHRRRCDTPGLVHARLSPAGASQLDAPRGPAPAPAPWDRLDEPTLTRENVGVWRLRVRSRRERWWKPRLATVDIELRLMTDAANALRRRIDEFRTRPGGPPS